MKTNREILIEGYFENRLSAQQKQEFEELLAKDSEFSEEVAFQRDLKKAIKMEERESLKAYFQTIPENKQPKRNWRWRFWNQKRLCNEAGEKVWYKGKVCYCT